MREKFDTAALIADHLTPGAETGPAPTAPAAARGSLRLEA